MTSGSAPGRVVRAVDRAQVPAFNGRMRYESTVDELVAEIANGQRTALARRKVR